MRKNLLYLHNKAFFLHKKNKYLFFIMFVNVLSNELFELKLNIIPMRTITLASGQEFGPKGLDESELYRVNVHCIEDTRYNGFRQQYRLTCMLKQTCDQDSECETRGEHHVLTRYIPVAGSLDKYITLIYL